MDILCADKTGTKECFGDDVNPSWTVTWMKRRGLLALFCHRGVVLEYPVMNPKFRRKLGCSGKSPTYHCGQPYARPYPPQP